MRLRSITAGILALALAFTGATAFVPTDTQAKSTTTQYVRLLHNKTYKKYDFTGDGKADSFKFNPIASDDDYFYEGMKIVLNGQKITLDAKKTETYFFDTSAKKAEDTNSEISFIRLKNGTTYLYCGFQGEDDYVNGMIFQYNSSKKKFYRKAKIGSIFMKAGYHDCKINKVSGNTIDFTIGLSNTSAGYVAINATYGYVKNSNGTVSICPVKSNGKKKTDGTYTITSVWHQYYDADTEEYDFSGDAEEPMTASYKLKLYSDPTLTTRSSDPDTESKIIIPVGESVVLSKIYIGAKFNSFFITTEDDIKGWIKDEMHKDDEGMIHGIFDEAVFAG